MNFASDNWSGAHPAILASLSGPAAESAAAYGGSELDRLAARRFDEIFGREVAVFFVGTGTAANALALASVARPGGVTFCHAESHLVIDEGGAPESLTGGARLCPVEGPLGRIAPDALEAAIARYPRQAVRHGQPMAVSITQATEAGTIYSPAQISELSAICNTHGLPLHMDGARFANAVAACGATPAALTSECGVDIQSFGATKNGCLFAEALVFLDPEKAAEFPFVRKRAAQLFSKSRFIAAQFIAYFDNGLWLEMAAHANRMAGLLARCVEESEDMRLAWACESNAVFAVMRQSTLERLQAQGAFLYPWSGPPGGQVPFIAAPEHGLAPDEVIVRMVTSFATRSEEIDRFAELA